MRSRFWKRIVKISLLLLTLPLLLLIYILYFLPLPDAIVSTRSSETTKIYDRNGVLLYEVLRPDEGRRTSLSFDQFPDLLIQATLAAEDSNFYTHGGVDAGGVLRAIWLNTSNQEVVSGGSTITQQLVKNLLSTNQDRTLYNKLLESAYALRLSQIQDKNLILARYLNTVYYGNLAYGAQAASLSYFGKNVYDLNLAEIALLAGIPNNPRRYNPLVSFDTAKSRQKEVLDLMVQDRLISADQAAAAQAEPLSFVSLTTPIRAPHFVQYVVDELEQRLGKEAFLYGGLQIYTTLDVYLNEEIERIINRQVAKLADQQVSNGAALVVDNATGQILAMVGSRDFRDKTIGGQVNVVFRLRQPGSALKPFTYLAALRKGWTPATAILDIPTRFVTEEGNPYTPQNFDLSFHGMVTVRDALANSYNIPAVKALEFVGSGPYLELLQRLGISTLDRGGDFYGLAATLGSGEVRLYDLVSAYSVLANQGQHRSFSYLLPERNDSRLQTESTAVSIVAPEYAFLITSILSDWEARINEFGANSVLNIPHFAIKTGTSRNFRDNVVLGYSPERTIGVWVGNNDATAMRNISGVTGAGPIFRDIVAELMKTTTFHAFPFPSAVERVEICLPSGKLPSPQCARRRREVFVRGTAPTEKDTLWQSRGGEVALSLPADLQVWARKQGYPVFAEQTERGFFQIQNPQNLDEFRINPAIPLDRQRISLRVDTSSEIDISKIRWTINDVEIGMGNEVSWVLRPGNFVIRAGNGQYTDQVSVIVR